ncbi:MAG TPA: hypothetical protein VEQ11_05025 [Chloroflexota bacterium]|nr:hypothetical protein [Chloroflexota bacterium]
MRIDVHCHAHPDEYIAALEASGRYQVDRDRTGLKIFKETGSRFPGITGPMSNIDTRIGVMDETEVAASTSASRPTGIVRTTSRSPRANT